MTKRKKKRMQGTGTICPQFKGGENVFKKNSR